MIDKQNFKRYLQILFIIFSLFLIIRYFLSHQEEFHLIFSIKLHYVFYLSALITSTYLLSSIKLYLILRKTGLKNCALISWFKIFTISNFVKLHIPNGGNLYRAIQLKNGYKFSYTDSIGSLIFFMWYEAFINLIIGVVFLSILQQNIKFYNIAIHWIFLLILLFLIVLPFLFANFLIVLRAPNSRFRWLREKSIQVTTQIKRFIYDAALISKMVIISVFSFIVYLILISLAFKAIGVSLPLSAMILILVAMLLSTTVNLLPGNIGLLEIICGYLASQLGISFGSGIIIAGLIRIVDYLTSAIFTLFFAKTLHFYQLISDDE